MNEFLLGKDVGRAFYNTSCREFSSLPDVFLSSLCCYDILCTDCKTLDPAN